MMDPGETVTIKLVDNNYDVTIAWEGAYTPMFEFFEKYIIAGPFTNISDDKVTETANKKVHILAQIEELRTELANLGKTSHMQFSSHTEDADDAWQEALERSWRKDEILGEIDVLERDLYWLNQADAVVPMTEEAIAKASAELDAEEAVIDELAQPPVSAKLCYINQHWNVYLYSRSPITWRNWSETYDQKTVPNDEGEFMLREYKHPAGIPIYGFGYMYNDANAHKRPGHQGEWSSNCKAINAVFGTNLIEVAVDQMAVSVPIDWLKELLGPKCIWQEDENYGEKIMQIEGEEGIWDKWVELIK